MEMENNGNNKVVVYGGINNGDGRVFYWKNGTTYESLFHVGSYAICENGDGYSLIKIIAIIEILEKDVFKLCGKCYHNMKKLIDNYDIDMAIRCNCKPKEEDKKLTDDELPL